MTDEFIFDSDELVTFCSELDAIPYEDLNESLLEVQLQDLNDRWATLQKSYRLLCTDRETKIGKDLLESVRGKHSACTKAFHKTKSRILDTQKSLLTLSASTSNPIEASQDLGFPIGALAGAGIPACDVKDFCGGYEEWPTFRDMFTAVYIDNPAVPTIRKILALRAKVQGDAGKIISKYRLCAENFNIVWEALRWKYENKRVLVDNEVNKILDLKPVKSESCESLLELQSTVNYCLSSLKALNVPTGEWDPILVNIIAKKLPYETLSLWEQSLDSHREVLKWDQMDKFLSNRYEVVERLQHSAQPTTQSSKSFNVSGNVSMTSQLCCKVCGANHLLRNCSQFIDFDSQTRNNFVSNNRICQNCLSSSHVRKDCTSRFTCSYCKKNHHSLLHFFKPSAQNSVEIETSNSTEVTTEGPETSNQTRGRPSTRTNVHFTAHQSSAEDTLLPTAIVQIKHRGDNFRARAFLDQGSKKSFISKRLQQQLMLPTEAKSFEISAMGDQVVGYSNSVCNFKLFSDKYNRYVEVKAIVVPKITSMLPSVSVPQAEIPLDELKDLELADPTFYAAAHVDLLLGSNVLPNIMLEGVKGICNSLMAQSTIFGWIVSGPIDVESVSTFHIGASEIPFDPLGEQLRKFWEQEEITDQHPVSNEEMFCETLYQETTFCNSEGRYVVKLPFRSEFPNGKPLGASRSTAIAQYLRMEKTLKNKPQLAETYNNVLREYITLKHMEPTASWENFSSDSYSSYYLPHHAVVKPESRSTKVRVVFNASKKTSSGNSLNDILHTGPTLQNDLMTLILQWRFYKFVFNGDIEKMYRQIAVHQDDIQFQRILFRPDATGPIQDFALKTVTFGVGCAPYLAIRTLLQLATDSEKMYPKASYILRKETYVDDILSGSHDLESAIESLSQLVTVLKSAGFPLKKITSNCTQILESVPQENILDSNFLKFHETSETKTLGIQWNALSDCFSYTVEPLSPVSSITKRKILSNVAKLFDPAGWISPIIVQAKILLQQLWLEGTNWDENVKQATLNNWNKFVENLPLISTLKIPRWVNFSPSLPTQIHGFCDASEKAYCATIYLRIQTGSSVYTNLLVSKTKVAPISPVSLPRLELCGAVLLSKLVKQIITSLMVGNYDLYLWCDSSIVLGWLEKPPNIWKTYVANRTAQIIRNVGNISWRHVRSADNPADLGSRGCNTDQLLNSTLWWHGPSWLQNPPEEWPLSIITNENPPEIKKKVEVFHLAAKGIEEKDHADDILLLFSKWDKAIRVMSYVFLFLKITKERSLKGLKPPLILRSQKDKISPDEAVSLMVKNILPIGHHEFLQTKNRLIAITQRRHYSREYNSLLQSKIVSKKSSLYPLNPYIDANDVIRANGRISNSTISFNERHPIILPVGSTFCKLLIHFTHNLLMHAENNLMIRAIRAEYFVSRLRSAVRVCIRECTTCVRYKQKVQHQMMAALPVERSSFSLPFTTTGLDFAGPFSIKTSILRNAPYHKGYVCLFICFCTKAIHLELCSDLTTGSFRAAFTRFVGRRGLPKKVMSDNGTNFIGAERALRLEHEEFIKNASRDIVEKYSSHGFHWSFIPPNAPHMGGLWEAGVKSFKMHFKKVSQNHKYTFEEFTTLLTRIESVLNSRPLSPMSDDPTEFLALTPGHFLRGAPLIAIPEVPDETVTYRERWEKLKILHHQFAQRWKDEYLKEMQQRYKWQNTEENVKVGQLVVLKDESLPPNEWKLGRIKSISSGQDELVRVADVRTQLGMVRRPIVKLCVLPVAASEESVPPLQSPNNDLSI